MDRFGVTHLNSVSIAVEKVKKLALRVMPESVCLTFPKKFIPIMAYTYMNRNSTQATLLTAGRDLREEGEKAGSVAESE